MNEYISLEDVREDIRLLADCMSTHSAFAKKVGISDAYLSDVITGKRNPGAKILKFLKLKKVIAYREIGK